MMLVSTSLLITTLDLSAESVNDLEVGMVDKAVIELEEDLKELGFASNEESTEKFDEDTKESIKSFQSYFDLEVNGKANEETLNKIDDILSSPFREGEYHEETIKLKKLLKSLGYWDTSSPTPLYDSRTVEMVEAFQADNSLPQSGIADEATWELLETLGDEPLTNPTRRADVIPLKENLELLGFGTFSLTDVYGSATERAVRSFQEYYNLTADGVADSATVEKLEEVALAATPFQNGERHEDTVILKEYLYTLGFWDSKSGTPLYGSKTERKIREFQEAYGLHESGVADPITWDVLEEEATGPLRNRMYRDDVVELKRNLELLGFGSFNMTAVCASQTEQSVRDFQAYFGLTVDGVVGDQTANKLEELAGSTFQNGERHEDTVILKEYLYTLGFWDSKSGTPLYGSKTERKVREFQEAYGLRESGIADPITWDVLEEEATGPLRNRMYRDDVVELKRNLELLGFGSFNMTDLFASQTEQSVRDFQAYFGLTVDGVVGDQTANKLEELAGSPFQNGERHEDTVILKEYLYTLGFWDSKSGTPLYGSKTERKVREFQEAYGLRESGIADPITWDVLEEEATGPLRNRMYRDDVVELKRNLELLGFGSFNMTDLFASQTEQSVRDFQAYFGLTVDGVVGDQTANKLEELAGSPFQNGERHEDTVILKEYLYTLGFWDSKSGTPLYGSKTERKVREFQEAYGLRESGIADPITWDVLEEEATGPLRNRMY